MWHIVKYMCMVSSVQNHPCALKQDNNDNHNAQITSEQALSQDLATQPKPKTTTNSAITDASLSFQTACVAVNIHTSILLVFRRKDLCEARVKPEMCSNLADEPSLADVARQSSTDALHTATPTARSRTLHIYRRKMDPPVN